MLSRLVIIFLSCSKHFFLNFMAVVTICSDFGAPPNKVCHCFHCFPIYLPWIMRPDAMILVFWMLSFKSALFFFSFTFKRLFSSSLLSAIRVVSSAYPRLLIFLLAILIHLIKIPLYIYSGTTEYKKMNRERLKKQCWKWLLCGLASSCLSSNLDFSFLKRVQVES